MAELQPPNRSEIIQRNAAVWIMKTKEYRRLTQTAINGIMEYVGHLFEMSFQEARSALQGVLSARGIDVTAIPELTSIFAPTSPYVSIPS